NELVAVRDDDRGVFAQLLLKISERANGVILCVRFCEQTKFINERRPAFSAERRRKQFWIRHQSSSMQSRAVRIAGPHGEGRAATGTASATARCRRDGDNPSA